MEMPAHKPNPLALLDGRDVPGGWAGNVARALDYLWSSSSEQDRTILFPLRSFLAEHARELADLRAKEARGGKLPSGVRETHPVTTALHLFRSSEQFAGMRRLLSVLVAASLENGPTGPDDQRKRIVSLASIVRGACEDRASPLRLILEDAHSLPGMIRCVDRHLEGEGAKLHQGFSYQWKKWIRDTLTRWIQADPERLSASLRPKALVAPIDSPFIGLGGDGVDPDDQTQIGIVQTDPPPASDPQPPGRILRLKALAKGIARASGGDLYLPPDQIAPSELIGKLANSAMKYANASLSAGQPSEAEPAAALSLALATAMREIDLGSVVWGKTAAGRLAAIDPDEPCLYRTVFMPPNSIKPGPELDGWLEPTVDECAWPLPPSLHQILKELSGDRGPKEGAPVLPLRSLEASDRYRLWQVSNDLAPDISLAPSQVRLAFAAELTRRFGPEVAQLVLGDTFSMSAAPAYYGSGFERDLIDAVADIQKEWFDETCRLSDRTPRIFGSRLTLTDEAASLWPAQLRQCIRSASHRKHGAELGQWIAHRDHLAGALCAVTGARPSAWLGEIDLDQIIPEYGLIILSDKASDILRETRVVATGRRWVADLRQYLDRLIRIAHGAAGPNAARWADLILRSEAPFFSIPVGGDDGLPFSVASLRATMPEPLQGAPNHYRHRLNRCLHREGVDPELRHAQLGWVVTPAHTLADLSEWSAKAFAAEMAPVLDDILVRDGWYPSTQRTPAWSWEGVPERPLKDWAAVVRAHESEHQANIRRLKENLEARWKEVSEDILTRLANAIAEYFPSLRLNVKTQRLEHDPGILKKVAVEMTAEHHALLCDRVRQDDKEPGDATEAVAARILLYRIVRAAQRKGLVKGAIPSRPIVSFTSDPSPFLKGLGLAVRHAESLRRRLLERASEQRAHDQGPLVTTAVLAYSAYRHIDLAMGAVGAAARMLRGHTRPDCIRIPATIDSTLVPMVFGGLPALLLTRRGIDSPTARPPTVEQLGHWLRSGLAFPMEGPERPDELAAHVAALFQASGRLELSGPERAAMLGHASLASVPVERSLARDDDWPLRTAVSVQGDDRPIKEVIQDKEQPPTQPSLQPTDRRRVMEGYTRLVAALNPENFPKIIGSKSDGHHGWRPKLKQYLFDLHQEVGERTNLGLLIGFTRHRLRHGGQRKRKLQHITLAGLTRFASDLLAIAGNESILDWDSDALRNNYLALLIGKKTSARRQAFDALAEFHMYLMQAHQAPEVALAELAAFAGDRVAFVDPGMVTDREVLRVLAVLQDDLATEQARMDAVPETVRSLELREIMFLILEGSGTRPSSAFGLTLGDVVLLGPGRDFIRIHTTGPYGRAKSTATLGFIPLEGPIWAKHRDRVCNWIDQQKALLEGTHWWKIPLFAIDTGAKRRFSRGYLTRRIDQLLKWATSNQKARTYWLRKNRVTARHENVVNQDRPMARDTYAAMCANGHALIQTPMSSYISDPAVVLRHQLREGQTARRADILRMSGLDGAQLDMAWLRAGGARSGCRLPTALGRLGSNPVAPPAELLTESPPLHRGAKITPLHIDDYARAMHRFQDQQEAMLHTGMSSSQIEALDRIAADFLIRKGWTPWPLPSLNHKSAVVKPPRKLKGTGKLFALLSDAPNADTKQIVGSFPQQAFLSRKHAPNVVMQLETPADVDASRRFLDATGVELLLDQSAGIDVLRTREVDDGSKAHAAAFRWVMAVLWIYSRFEEL